MNRGFQRWGLPPIILFYGKFPHQNLGEIEEEMGAAGGVSLYRSIYDK